MFAYLLDPGVEFTQVLGYDDLAGQEPAWRARNQGGRTLITWEERTPLGPWRKSTFGRYSTMMYEAEPQVLQRRSIGLSSDVTLAERSWRVPVALRSESPRAEPFFRAAEALISGAFAALDRCDFADGAEPTLDVGLQQGWELACAALVMNYYLTKESITQLELLGDEEIRAIVAAVLDIDLIVASRRIRRTGMPDRTEAAIDYALWKRTGGRPPRPYDLYWLGREQR